MKKDNTLISLDDMAAFLGVRSDILMIWATDYKVPHFEFEGAFLFSYPKIADWVLTGKLKELIGKEANSVKETCEDYFNNGYKWKNGKP